MAKNLIIVESPTKTKTIGKILGKDYKVLASKGHLRDLPKSQFGVDIENDFEPKYINVRGKAKTINELKKAAKEADAVYLATDPDREGEAISWHLSYLLGMDPNQANRVTFHEITKNGVKEGIESPRKIDQNLVDAQQARRVMDRIVGYEISPILWKKIKGGLSAGRVQSVALKMIVDREREIQNFVSEEYWSIHAEHEVRKFEFQSKLLSKLVDGKPKSISIANKEEADQMISELGDQFTVYAIEKKNNSRKPYAPFTTSTLQQEASRRLGFSTAKTMSTAQQLYEGVSIPKQGQVGLITYMRTDSTRLSDSFCQSARNYIVQIYGKEYATSTSGFKNKNVNSQDAHEAIRPTDPYRTPKELEKILTKDQYRLYELIWMRTIASQMKSLKTKSTVIDLENNGYLFRANGQEVIFDGFTKVWKIKENIVFLPEINKNETISATKIESKQHFTQPPARYSEAGLVQMLEKNGIGRPSTYSATIQSILSRNYVLIENKQFKPTELGFHVHDLLMHHFSRLINEKFTAEMEKKLDEIAEGKLPWKMLMGSFYQDFSKELEVAKKDETSYKLTQKKVGRKCPVCGSDLCYRQGRNGEFIGCSAFPNCTYTEAIVVGTGVKCPKCGGEIVEKVSKRGKVFYGCSNYPECDYASWDKPTGDICPECGDLMVHRKNRKENIVYCHNENCKNHKI